MKKFGKFLIYFVSLALIVLLSLNFAGVFPPVEKIKPGKKAEPENLRISQTLVLEEQEIPIYFEGIGTVRSREEISISSRIVAKITEITVREGDTVKSGQIIVRLDDMDLKATVGRLQEVLKEAEVNLGLQEKEFERVKTMFEKNVTSKKALEQAESSYQTAKAAVSAAEQSIKEAESALSYANIASPIDGIVSRRNLDPGALAMPGISILNIFDDKRLMLYLPVSESLIPKIKIGDKVSFYVEALAKKFEGEVKEMTRSIDTDTRTMIAKICIGVANDLIPGMSGKVSIRFGSEKALLIPESAITKCGQLEYVTKISRNGAPLKTLVRTVESGIPGQLKVISGLRKGDIIAKFATE